MTSHSDSTRGRDLRSRPRAALVLAPAAAVAALVVGGAVYAGSDTWEGTSGPPREGNALVTDWQARNQGQQVLGGSRTPGTPTIQRIRHDDVQFTVTVAPARPGRNLVRVDATPIGDTHRHRGLPVLVGTGPHDMVRAVPRPGTDGLWAVVDLPEGQGTVLVSHGPRHRVPFAVETGIAGSGAPDTSAWTSSDGPECLTSATGSLIAGGLAPTTCPAEDLTAADRGALVSVVATLASRGVTELAVEADGSPRSRAAYAAVREAATAHHVRVVDPADPPGTRNALLVVSGWADAARTLTRTTALPLARQPMRSDGTWLAPWLLTPQVVDSTLGAILPLDFDVRDPAAQEFSQTLVRWFPGQSPTAAGYLAWRAQHGDDPDPWSLYAATRAAYMPAQGHHQHHETAVAWFPGGTVTPVGLLAPASS
ncbi:hypothetical protein FB382_002382 [Nocardioides ginsengisegetis]|uniref:Uncharacterized protein n=1 Tax=Nocardioides ginsengisegetis TaxID=661491 RepID=A0A7W3J0N8_9ACTN|nr:hypothetical protein [Nocardioides ginsengisegetis]MBA8804091.1 hypothetical protein [Nocardioides ginsengisegetis]